MTQLLLERPLPLEPLNLFVNNRDIQVALDLARVVMRLNSTRTYVRPVFWL